MSEELEAITLESSIENILDIIKVFGKQKDGRYIITENALNAIEQALTPPTVDEVCDALSEYGKKTGDWEKVWFKDNTFYADEWTLCYMNKNGGLELSSDIDAKSHILLGRFYESEAQDV